MASGVESGRKIK